MSKQITFAELEKLLLELGFIPSPAQGTHQVFKHLNSGTLVILPGYNKQDIVNPAHLVSTRRVLVENSLMNEEAFDALCNDSKVSA
jgi:predicted RNA binding protein YcfA (HicA-like mRNA interferase family)